MDFIREIEINLGKKALCKFLPIQPGDVPVSHADIESLIMDYTFKPITPIAVGIKQFINWYKNQYNVT